MSQLLLGLIKLGGSGVDCQVTVTRSTSSSGSDIKYRFHCAARFFAKSFLLQSQIGSTVVKAFAFQADGLGFNSPSGYKVGRPGHSKCVGVTI